MNKHKSKTKSEYDLAAATERDLNYQKEILKSLLEQHGFNDRNPKTFPMDDYDFTLWKIPLSLLNVQAHYILSIYKNTKSTCFLIVFEKHGKWTIRYYTRYDDYEIIDLANSNSFKILINFIKSRL